ncbi:hypothetical protein HAX54_034015 [Datura stramonium]|uniref:Uncharacterized protein n=1 Tax=Datura stramonium TaxID=4076 RepID=A0ABS8VE06_DATST|nr:hypothetical protein [Datura stramonium]
MRHVRSPLRRSSGVTKLRAQLSWVGNRVNSMRSNLLLFLSNSGRAARRDSNPPTPWFVATCSNPLTTGPPRLHWICLEYPQKEPFLSQPFRVKKMWRVYLYKKGAFRGVKWEKRDVTIGDLPYSIVTAVEFNHQVRDGLVVPHA